jgi:hypothetical protein
VDSGVRPRDGGRDSGRVNPPRDGGADANTTEGTFIDPKCPVQPPPIKNYACDLRTQTGCEPGEGCYSTVEYPSSSCEAEKYGSVCFPAGTGVQDAPCGGGTWCSPGYDCVIGSGGTICAKQCDLNRPGSCPEGRVCQATDVLDVGVCD